MSEENELAEAVIGIISVVILVVFCIFLWKASESIRKEINDNGLKSIVDKVWMGTNVEDK